MVETKTVGIILVIFGVVMLIVLGATLYFITGDFNKSNFDSICGNEICELDESIDSCFDDCAPKEEFCGDGFCQDNEDENSCNEDCEIVFGEFIT